MTQPDHIKLLRAAGEDRAADMLAALQSAEAAEGETPETPAPPQTTAMSPGEASRQAEGRALLEEMRRAGILDRFETEPTT